MQPHTGPTTLAVLSELLRRRTSADVTKKGTRELSGRRCYWVKSYGRIVFVLPTEKKAKSMCPF